MSKSSVKLLLDQGVDYAKAGRSEEAERCFQEALHKDPECARAYLNMGTLCMVAGEYATAAGHFSRAVELEPDYVQAWNNLLGAQVQRQLWDEAVATLERLLDLAPDHPGYMLQLAKLHIQHSEFEKAETLLNQAIMLSPEEPVLYVQLALCMMQSSRWREAIAILKKALALDAEYAEAHKLMGDVYFSMNKIREAERAYRKAIAADATYTDAYSQLGRMLYKNGYEEKGIEASERAIASAPDRAAPYNAFAEMLLVNGQRLDKVQTLCERSLAISPGNRESLTMLTLTYHERGGEEAWKQLVDPEVMMPVTTVEVPEGYASLDAFNEVLCEVVHTHPNLNPGTPEMPIRDGLKTGELLIDPPRPVQVLEAIIRQKVEEYIARLPKESKHPFYGTVPKHWKLSIWGNIIQQGGEFGSHTHPPAWLSGVYYAQVPSVAEDREQCAGWIEFHRPEPKYQLTNPPAPQLVQPRNGVLVMFPSYVFHRTVPFSGEEERISLAFDVLPIKEEAL